MSKKNILRLNRQSVLDNFIVSFYANELNSNFYSKANLPQKWLKELDIGSVERISSSDYEETLSNFFNKGNSEFTNHPLLIILGGVGTGKSSSIRHSLSSSTICEECSYIDSCSTNFPARIIVDFINFRSAVATETPEIIKPTSIKETTEKFWYHILTILDEVINDEMDTQMEISEFWGWLFKQKSVAVPINLYKILYPKKRLFENYNDNGDSLLSLKDSLFEKLNTKELSQYKLFQIAYLRQNKTANCNFILFDNIDTLAPYLQADLVNFALEAHRLLKSRAVIPVRPHTLATNKDASDFFEILEHWKPSLEDVFKLRLREFKTKTDKETYLAVASLVEIIKRSKIFKSIFIGTSGKSVRYALRNFYNLSLSPLIITHIDNKPVEIELDLNIFFQAYFCSETKNEMLDEDNFHNMLSIRKSIHQSYFSNLKLRFLHLMYTNNSINLGKLFKTLYSFGYEKYEILLVLNEFLDPKKSLIWSSTLTQYSKKDIKNGDIHILRINHLGINYFEKVLSEPLYLRECIIGVTTKRHKGRQANLSIVINTLKELEDTDYEEIRNYIENKGLNKYNEIYNKDKENSISYIMWGKIKDALSYWKTINSEFIFDYDRDRHIKERVNKIKAENKKYT